MLVSTKKHNKGLLWRGVNILRATKQRIVEIYTKKCRKVLKSPNFGINDKEYEFQYEIKITKGN